MPRPSLKDQRTDEILNAFERCILRVGLAGSSLEAIAEEAGMKRSILRHYIGNRDEILEALARRVIERYRDETEELIRHLPRCGRGRALVDFLFHDVEKTNIQSLAVAEALTNASIGNDTIRQLFSGWLDQFVGTMGQVLHDCYPERDQARCWAVAYGLASIYFSHEAMTPLALPAHYGKAAVRSARALVDSLERD
ncbi:TetR/AcrR family transcriptional regulator [Aestuariispira insulae]|uniref:TetR family transcriptional regulator n=1 Tax=Aestuariispira insulae TaxID=1461337 RepID=A0A3D9HPA6_9PROT|nr:TetR/AcrR family transcriptional regulator [Aestuariispira insulae]RED51312.1 TetR family transcriptional regulator [Aestuariispira insulae]